MYIYFALIVFVAGLFNLVPNSTLSVVFTVFGAVAVTFWLQQEIFGEPYRDPNVFWYKYQRHPFDNAQYFWVRAENREKANEIAMKEYDRLVKIGRIVWATGVLYPCEPPMDY